MTQRHPLINKELIQDYLKERDQQDLMGMFSYSYQITYIKKELMSFIECKKLFQLLQNTLGHLGKLTKSKIQTIYQDPIQCQIIIEVYAILLQQSTDHLKVFLEEGIEDSSMENLDESKFFYKEMYIQLMEQIKDILYGSQTEGLLLINVCMNQLLNGVQHYKYTRKDTEYMIEFVTKFLENVEIPLNIRQSITKQVMCLNQEKKYLISQTMFKNLIFLMENKQELSFQALQTICFWKKQQCSEVYQQIQQLLDTSAKYIDLDELSQRYLIQVITNLFNSIVAAPISDGCLSYLKYIIQFLWDMLEEKTFGQVTDDKMTIWLGFIQQLDEKINPSTNIGHHIPLQQLSFGLLMLLKNGQYLLMKRYITVSQILIQFIDTIFPVEQTIIKQNPIVQELIQTSVEFMIQISDNILNQADPLVTQENLNTFDKTMKLVVYLNPGNKEKIFQLIWKCWNEDDIKYLKVIQLVANNYLQNNENANTLGTRNIFFHSILAYEKKDKYKHLIKIRVLLQIFQYLCLDNQQIDIMHIFGQKNPYQNIFELKKQKIKRSFQEFFQINKYLDDIMNIIKNSTNLNNNSSNLFFILRELLKLTWLLSEGCKLDQIEFVESYISFLRPKIQVLQEEQQFEILDLVFDCSTSMISRYIRFQHTDKTNHMDYFKEVMITNQLNLKIFVDVFLHQDMTKKVTIHCLTYLDAILSYNQYNQQIFRETVDFTNLLDNYQNSDNVFIRDYSQDIIKKGLSYIKNSQIDNLIKNAPKEKEKLKRHSRFRQNAFTQYVGATLASLGEGIKDEINLKSIQLLGKESNIQIRQYNDFTRKDWKSFTIFLQYKLNCFKGVNNNCQEQNHIIQKEFQLFCIQDDKGFEYLTVSIVLDNKQETDYKLVVKFKDEKGQVKVIPSIDVKFSIDFELLRLVYDDKSKGQFKIQIGEDTLSYVDKFNIRDLYKQQSQKYNLNLVLGKNNFQGILQNFIVLDGIIYEDRYKQIMKEYNLNKNLLQSLERDLKTRPQEENFNDQYTEIQYLEIEKFKTSLSQVELKDGLKYIKAEKNVEDSNFIMNMIKRDKKYNILQGAHQSIKTYYSGVYCIETVSLAEIFLTLENIDIIFFLICIATTSPCAPGRMIKQPSQIFQRISEDKPGVYKIKNYVDKSNRKLFIVKDMKKCPSQYLSSAEFQSKLILEKQFSINDSTQHTPSERGNCSIISPQKFTQTKELSDSIILIEQPDQFSTPTQDKRQILAEQKVITAYFSTSQQRLVSPRKELNRSIDSIPSNKEINGSPIKKERESLQVQPFRRDIKKHTTHLLNKRPSIQYDTSPSQKIIPIKVKSDEINENAQLQYTSELITPKGAYYGYIVISRSSNLITFKCKGTPRPESTLTAYGTTSDQLRLVKKYKEININNIEEIQTRRYSLKEIAIEIFLRDQTSYFLNLYKSDTVKDLMSKLKIWYPKIEYVVDRKLAFKNKDYTNKWIKGEISNFDYLMIVNKYSGRTFNDLNQYPVFPWILQDYESKKIDLNNIKHFRDLEKPIGTMNKDRLESCKSKAQSLLEIQNEYYLYGSHYSISAMVINQLVRIEPFTTLLSELQAGKFDQPDRLFFSIPNTWYSCMTDGQDFRELIPEYFYLPEFLINSSNINFGFRQNEERVHDVVLPPWASNPYEFIEIHRRALESDIVSQRLHSWINLIFGYQSLGEEAKKKDNVFHPLTYEQCWQNLDKCSLKEKQGYILQIQSFGQTPFQLFSKPHPQKIKVESIQYTPSIVIKILSEQQENWKKLLKFDKRLIIKILKEGDFVYCVLSNKQIHRIKYSAICSDKREQEEKQSEKSIINLVEIEKLHQESSFIGNETDYQNIKLSKNQNQCIASGEQFDLGHGQLFVSGYVSGAVYCYSGIDKQNPYIDKLIKLHKKPVNCVAYSKEMQLLCLGGKDNRITVWKFRQKDNKFVEKYITPIFIFYEHEQQIKCMKIDEISYSLISADRSGRVRINSLKSGLFLKEIQIDLKNDEKILQIEVDGNGSIIFLTNFSNIIVARYNLNKQVKYHYKDIGDISHMQIYMSSNLIVSTLRGELLLIQDVNLFHKDPPLICHLYINKNKIGISTFLHFIEPDSSLVFLLALNEGSLVRFQIISDKVQPFLTFLNQHLAI